MRRSLLVPIALVGGLLVAASAERNVEAAPDASGPGTQPSTAPATPSPEPEAADWQMKTNITPNWQGWEARIALTGPDPAHPVEFTLTPSSGGEPVAVVVAVPGPPGITGSEPLLDSPSPPHVPTGTHGIAIPAEIPEGEYLLTHESDTGRASATIFIGAFGEMDWYWWGRYPFPGCGWNDPGGPECDALLREWESGAP